MYTKIIASDSNGNSVSGTEATWKRLYQEDNTWLIFGIIVVLYGYCIYVQSNYVFTDEVYYRTLGDQVAVDRIAQMLEWQNSWNWMSYLILPVSVIIQIGSVAVCLNIGIQLSEKFCAQRIKFKDLFRVATQSSLILPVYAITVLLVNLVFNEVNVMSDYQRGDFFSLAGLTSTGSINEWWVIPLRSINLFEAIFWVLLAGGLTHLLRISFSRSIALVASTYGVGLVFWIVFLMFIQLNFVQS